MARMRIAIDIDDTLTDSFDYFIPFVAEFFGAEENDLRRRGISYSTLPPAWKKDEFAFGKAYYDRIVPATPFKPDAAWGVNALRAAGHRIIIITGRTTAFYTDPEKTTREELARGGIVYDKLICTLDKGAACRAEKIDLLLDDLPANCAAAEKQGASALLFNSAANQDASAGLRRVNNWREAVAVIAQINRQNETRR